MNVVKKAPLLYNYTSRIDKPEQNTSQTHLSNTDQSTSQVTGSLSRGNSVMPSVTVHLTPLDTTDILDAAYTLTTVIT